MSSRLAKAQSTATAAVDKDARPAVVPYKIAAGCALILKLRAA